MAKTSFGPKLISLAVASCFASGAALANPTGANVVHGTAAIHQAGNLLQITNSPNAIINWQSFSIGANEITRFIQQSASSAVLNRVVTQDPSTILGALQSNGRVFLINPNGILFGAGAQIDVAGLVASTLNMSDADFLGGRLRFTDGLGRSVINDGSISTAAGGSVYLIGSGVTNNGIITSPTGEVILAAGNSIELVDPGTPNLRVEVAALDHEARNLGQIISDAGRIGIYAGLINNSGAIRADSAVSEGGRIVLKATKSATLAAESVTTASGTSGGNITIQSGDTTLVAGTVEAKGLGSPPAGGGVAAAADGVVGEGGTIQILGNLVGLSGNAALDASGETGGGTVLVGGDFQGKNPEIQNAFRTYVGVDATIRADAITSGDGGKVIVWSDDTTRAYGTISARGGAQSGNGGFVETSGHYLEVTRAPDLGAPNGGGGTWLLDPLNLEVVAGAGVLGSFQGVTGTFTPLLSPSQIGADVITTALNAGTSVTLTTVGTTGVEAGDINVNAAIVTTQAIASTTLSLIAANNININQPITLTAGAGGVASIAVSAAGAITVKNSSISANGGGITTVNGGAAEVTLNAGSAITLNNSIVSATGAGGLSGGSGTAMLSAGGGITISGSTVSAKGGDGSSGAGGNATVTLISGGDIALASSVNANGGIRSTPGTARIFLTFLSATGNFSVNGVPGAIVDTSMVGEGFFVDGSPAILGVNFFVTNASPVFNDVLVAIVNQQVDVLADQLRAGVTGELEEEKKKLPFCS